MTVAEKVQQLVGVTPTYTTEERESVRQEANSKATSQWFKQVLAHHVVLEKAFADVKAASTATTRKAAQEKLGLILMGHAIAEEAIVYPFMKLDTSSSDATHAYNEQVMVKIEMVKLDSIADKMSDEYDTKLEEIRTAVEHHMIEEERDFFPELQDKVDSVTNQKISEQYQMEFKRYANM